VSTTSAEAQRFYDQGLAYLHSYVWIEAARSFHQALRLDPALAMAHVGLSYAFTELNKPDAAREALAKARALAAGASDHDRRHVELRAMQMTAEDEPGNASRLIAYRAALDSAMTTFPRCIELVLLRGVAESPDPADRGQGSPASAAIYFARALARSQDHVAAHHYSAHALENGGKIQEAVEHARAYARLAPELPHARHMHAHSLRRTGRIHEAIAELEAADQAQRAYLKRESIAAEHDWHHHHNLDLMATSYQYVGQMERAERLYRSSFAMPSNLVAQLFNKKAWPEFLRARGRFAEAFEAATALKAHPHPLVQAAGHIESGYAVLDAGRFADAAVESNAALKILRAGPEGAPMAAHVLLGLQGEISLRTAQRERGRQVLDDVARRVRSLPGADNWVLALFTIEGHARTARQVGDWELAGRLAKAMMDHDASYAGSHYATALVAERNDDAAGARTAFGAAQKLWSKADPSLPELAEIRKRLR
jgi:Tfp pilus assembly protein PilF